MEMRLGHRRLSSRWSRPVLGWSLLGLVMVLPAVLVAWQSGGLAAGLLDWQPALAASEPWRAWSAAWVHLSRLHLEGCLAAAALVVLLGVALPAAPRTATAWALSWPLTHLSLVLQPELQHYAGMSGVLHAGVAVMVVQMLKMPSPWHRALGGILGLGLIAKLVLEAPWAQAIVRTPEWDIPVAPLAHAAGAFWGAVWAWMLVRPQRPA